MIFRRRRSNEKTVNLALQGGGAHGAFTWGVLDRLLEDSRLQIEGVSGTSSGAMNAAALASGLAAGGREAARATLARFWTEMSAAVPDGLKQRNPLALWSGDLGIEAFPALKAYLDLARVLSPAQLNPLDLNPLREVLLRVIDFDRLTTTATPRLFISATNVHTGKVRIFANREITVDALLASACLPSIHRAVEIGGELYWDGGYSGNPPVFPLIFNCRAPDIVVVMAQPLRRTDTPASPEAIQRRQAELSFNTAFLREMRAIAMCKAQIEEGGWFPTGRLERRLARLKLHLIEAEGLLRSLGPGSHFNTEMSFLTRLRDAGRDHTQAWLATNFDALGERSTVDMEALFL
jgi:NTE family protein